MDTVTISREQFENLERCRKELDALEQAGVDNWEGYSTAMRSLQGDED